MKSIRSSLALVVALGGAAVSSNALAQDQGTLAQQRFLRGLAAFDGRQFAAALEEFRGSYALRASPNSRLYIARALRELQQLPEAVTEYETCVQEAREHANTDARYRETQRAAEQELSAIVGRVGRVQITLVNAPRQVGVRIGPHLIPSAGLTLAIAVQPGPVTITAEAVGSSPVTQSTTVVAGAVVPVTLTFAADAQQRQDAQLGSSSGGGPTQPSTTMPIGEWVARGRSPLRAVMFASWGLGVAGMITFAATGVAASSTFAGLQMRCGAARCPSNEQGAVDTGRALQTTANVSLAVGIVGLVAGTTLLFVGPRTERPATAPAVSLGLGAIHLHGAF
ncbi:MAG: hypothetical protein U0269_23815 [Polyangiales bacterium]